MHAGDGCASFPPPKQQSSVELHAWVRNTIASLQATIEALQSTLLNHANENEILKRRLYGTKTERGGTSELQLLLGDLLSQQAVLQKQLDALAKKDGDAPQDPPPAPPTKEKPTPKGRRDLSTSSLPKIVVDIRDEELEKNGKFIDWDISYQLMRLRGGLRVLVKRTAKYELVVGGETTVLGTPSPRTLFPRTMLHTSVLAWIVVEKFALGVPHYRLEQHLKAQGECLDRGTNLATKALGYVINQEQELRRVLLDGRLPLDNTRSERALQKIVTGRKNWMFYGSDLHADAAAAIFTVIASCRLHRIDPEQYIDEVLRLLPYWPKERFLELAPKYWARTRARLDPLELEVPIGEISVPPILSAASA